MRRHARLRIAHDAPAHPADRARRRRLGLRPRVHRPPAWTVGEGAIVGAAAVAMRDVPAWAVVAGNPAEFVQGAGKSRNKKRGTKGPRHKGTKGRKFPDAFPSSLRAFVPWSLSAFPP